MLIDRRIPLRPGRLPMADDAEIRDRITRMLADAPVVLFMKGSREAPRCGFSARVVALLDQHLAEYATHDVLSDPALRQGIKDHADWPTVPQLWVHGTFVGGCDIVTELAESGELEAALAGGAR